MNENFKCSSCSKESYKTVPIARVMEKLDELFSRNDLPAVGRLLDYWENEARIINDSRGLIEILNEKIGYYRRTSEKEKGLASVYEAFELIEKLNATELVSSATVYLNGATTLKSFGKTLEAMPYYDKAERIYLRELGENDFRLAAFYNNVSSAYIDLGKNDSAEKCCLRALDILDGQKEFLGEMAVTKVNLAHLYYDADPFDDRAYKCMDDAWEYLTSKECKRDGNFAFVCSKCYPSFGFFGYFEREAELKALMEKIYAGN